MSSFRSTLLFAVVVGLTATWAYLEFNKSNKEAEIKETAGYLYPHIKSTDIQKLHFKSGVNEYQLIQDKNEWQIQAQFTDRADDESVDDFLTGWLTQNIDTVDLEGQAIDWEKYGLAQPMAQFEMTQTSGQIERLQVGSVRTFDQGFYIRKNDSPVLYVGDKSWESYISKTANEFRNKKILFSSADFNRLKIIQGPAQSQPAIELSKKEGLWVLNENQKIRLSSVAIQDYFVALKNLRFDEVLAESKDSTLMQKYKLTAPEFMAELNADTFAAAKISDTAWSFVSSLNGPIYQVSAQSMKPLIKHLNDFRDKNYFFKFDATQAHKLTMQKQGGKTPLEYVKANDQWVAQGENQKKLNQGALNNAIRDLTEMKVDDFKGLSSKNMNLDHKIAIKDKEDKILFSLDYGQPSKNTSGVEVYLAYTNLSEEAFTLEKAAVDAVVDQEFLLVDKKP